MTNVPCSSRRLDIAVNQPDAAKVTPPFRAMMTLYLGMMAVGMGQTVVFAVLPMLGRELALDKIVVIVPLLDIRFEPRELAITSLSALTALVFSIAAPFWGRMSDWAGRKPLIITGLLGYTVGTALFNTAAYLGLAGVIGGTGLYFLLLSTRALQATVMSATMPSASAYIVDVTTLRERTKGMGRMAACNQIGAMIGPAFAWFVAISFLAPMYIQAGITLLVAILVWRYLPAIPPQAYRRGRKRLRYLDPRYRAYILIGFSMFTLMGMVQQTLGFYFQDTLGLSSVRAAQLFSVAMVVSSSAMLAAQFGVVQRFGGHPMLLLRYGLPFSLAAYLLLANAGSLPTLLTAMGLLGFGMGLAGPGFNVSATLEVEGHEQGGLAGLLGSTAGMGFVVGPLVGGYLYRFSPVYPYWCAAVVLTAVLVYVWRLKARPV